MADTYHKLVRDKIPEIIRRQGHDPKVMILDDENYFASLRQKLKEEVAEYFEENDVHELSDIAEVVLALAKYQGLSHDDFERMRKAKAQERGGFEDRIFLLTVERTE